MDRDDEDLERRDVLHRSDPDPLLERLPETTEAHRVRGVGGGGSDREGAMAASPDPDPMPTPSGQPEDGSGFRTQIDAIRAESEEMRDSLIDVLDAAEAKERRDEKLTRALTVAAAKKGLLDPQALRKELDGLLEALPHLAGNVRQHVTKLISDIRQSQDHWPDPNDLGGAPAAAERALVEIQDVALQAAYIVLPHRIRSRLQRHDAAHSLVFWDEYKDELATREQGDVILGWLASTPRSSGILVDPDEGVIYKLPSEREQWFWGLAGLWGPVLSVIPILIVSWLGGWLGISDSQWPFADTSDMIALYVCVLIGAGLHFLASIAKGIDFDGELAVTRPAGRLAWLSIRWTSVLALMLPPLVTAIALGMTELRPDSFEDFSTLVLAGYGADSLAPIFLSRLGRSADRASESLTQKPKREDHGADRRGSREGGRDERRRAERH